MGGVLCPQANCGMGLLPEDEERRVDCPRDSGGCGVCRGRVIHSVQLTTNGSCLDVTAVCVLS